jgi:hypothetical protein
VLPVLCAVNELKRHLAKQPARTISAQQFLRLRCASTLIDSSSDNEDTDATVEGANAPECANDSSSDNEDTDATVKDANAPECEFLFIDLLASESTD